MVREQYVVLYHLRRCINNIIRFCDFLVILHVKLETKQLHTICIACILPFLLLYDPLNMPSVCDVDQILRHFKLDIFPIHKRTS